MHPANEVETLRYLPLLLALCALPAAAEEGMWTYDAFPSEAVKKAHGFSPSPEWLERVRLASLRLGAGCSASFASSQGLVLTNHHCIRSCVEELSSPEEDLLARGFFAAEAAQERRCPGLEVSQLVELKDVTARLQGATRGLSGKAFNDALKAEMTKVESECSTGPQVRCDVVTLYNGGRYHLYRYRRYQDVRLAFAPEFPMASFGGDPDNFNFPRFGFDMALLRVWEEGKPVGSPHYLPWAREGVKAGELVFVSGHPGSTERQRTVAELEFQRDVALPNSLLYLAEQRGMLREFALRSPEHERQARSRLRTVENGLKALRGRHQALADPALLAGKRKEEAGLQARVRADKRLRATTAGAWEAIARTLQAWRPRLAEYRLKEGREGLPSELFAFARTLVRAAEEQSKPDTQRLREYTSAQLPLVRQRLLREGAIEQELEVALLAFGLHTLRNTLGPDDPYVRTALGAETPEARARALVEGTKLADVAVRRALLEGGKAAVEASEDPMVVLARQLDGMAREARRHYEDAVEAELKRQGELIAQARRVLAGSSGYPDATSTLRLSYGTVQGWTEADRSIGPFTTLAGAFARHTRHFPFKLPDTWLAARERLPPQLPLNMTTTHDIIGGNSGSPMVDREGRLVGLVFDGNLPSLGGSYAYVPESNRAVSVYGSALLVGLEQIYGARRLVEELRAHQR